MTQLDHEIGLSGFESHYLQTEEVEKIFDTRRARIAVILNVIRPGYANGPFEIKEQFLLEEVCRLFSFTNQEFAVIEN